MRNEGFLLCPTWYKATFIKTLILVVISQKLFTLQQRNKTNLVTKQNENVSTLNLPNITTIICYFYIEDYHLSETLLKKVVEVSLLFVKAFETDL